MGQMGGGQFQTGQSPNFAAGQSPTFPSAQGPNFGSTQGPNFPSAQGTNFASGQGSNYPSNQAANFPTCQAQGQGQLSAYPQYPDGQMSAPTSGWSMGAMGGAHGSYPYPMGVGTPGGHMPMPGQMGALGSPTTPGSGSSASASATSPH